MVEIERIYKKTIDGKMFFYVDDSSIFTNDIIDIEDFKNKINKINSNIHQWMEKLYIDDSKNALSKDVCEFTEKIMANTDIYHVNIHGPEEKSTISNIADGKEGEVYLQYIGRETSKTAFDMNTGFSEEEANILSKKTKCILEAIEKELQEIEQQLTENDKTDNLLNKESQHYKKLYKKKLIRYKKFFKYRSKDLQYRETTDIEKIKNELLSDLKLINENDEDGIEKFFEMYNEDTLGVAINFVLNAMSEMQRNYSEILEQVKKLNVLLYEKGGVNGLDWRKSSYLYMANIEYFKKQKIDYPNVSQYTTLKLLGERKYRYLWKKNDSIIKNVIKEKMLKFGADDLVQEIMGEEFWKNARIVIANSNEMQRQCANTILSSIMQIEVGDEAVLQKRSNRKITYTELRVLTYLRNKHFSYNMFEKKKNEFEDEEYQLAIDYSVLQVLGVFKTFVSNPEWIDSLIMVHKYTCDIWKNGSKYLYFYTLHNQEHAVDLIQNSLKIIRAIDYINISKENYYILFLACYLHDISMVTFPDLNTILDDSYESNKLYSDFVKNIKEELRKTNLAKEPVKKILRDYYMKIDAFFENLVRSNHAKNSAKEIIERKDIGFIDEMLRSIVAEVAEAHGQEEKEVYKIKSNANTKRKSQKFSKIILRIADLLDMSNYRVSPLVLDHNLMNMGEVSRFHWLSHLVTRGYMIENEYQLNKEKKQNYLEWHSILEKIVFKVEVDLPQMTHEISGACEKMNLIKVDNMALYIKIGEKCDGEKCNFLCKWFVRKNWYLFSELAALQEYLNSLPDNYFKSEIKVEIHSNNRDILAQEKFTLLREYVDR